MPGPALDSSPHRDAFNLDEMLQALVEGRGEWVSTVTRPYAEAGVAKAQLVMGILYQVGLGVAQDCDSAIRFYREAAKQNEPLAWKNLGTIYLLGLAGIPISKAEARRCFANAKAAEAMQSATVFALDSTVH